MKLPRLVRRFFKKVARSPAVSAGGEHAPGKSPWNCRFEIASKPGLTLGYLDGFDERGRILGWMETSIGAGDHITLWLGETRVTARAEVYRNDVIEAGHVGGRGFVIDVIALAPLLEGLLKGHELRILGARDEPLCEPLLWTMQGAEERSRVLFVWLMECFKASLEGDLETRELATACCILLARLPEMADSVTTQPAKLDKALKGMQDLCASNLSADSAFADNLRTLRNLCLQLGRENPQWENAAAGFEVALQVENFLGLLRREWRERNLAPTSLRLEPYPEPAEGSMNEDFFMAPPLYPDRLHYLPWDGWVRKALENGLVFAANLAKNESPSAQLIDAVTRLGSSAALLYRDESIVVGVQRLARLCGGTDSQNIGIEARALKRLGRFTEAFALEKNHGIDTVETPEALLACFTTAIGVALEIHQPLGLKEVQAWRQRLEPLVSDVAMDELLQRTLGEYIAFCGRAVANPHALGATGLRKVWKLRGELIQSIRELLHLASPHGDPAIKTIPKARGRRVLIVGSADLPQVRLYRQIQKIEALNALRTDIDDLDVVHVDTWQQINSPQLTQQLAGTALLVICRLPATQAFLRLVHAAKGTGIPVFYDIDDLLFDAENFPPAYPTYAGSISRRDHRRLGEDTVLWLEAMRSADTLLVSTPTLASRARELLGDAKKILIEPNHAPALLLEQAAITSMGGWSPVSDVHLVYGTGTLAHKQILVEWIFPLLRELLQRHSNLQISLVGRMEEIPAALAFHPRVRIVPFGAYSDYLSILASADISLAPLEPGLATDAKSALKWMEAAMLGAACVVSPTATYQEILESEVDVLFATTPDEWRAQLGRLIEGHQFRRRVAKAANSKAKRLAGPGHARDFWRSRLAELPAFGTHAEEGKVKRLLVANLYFWPQAAGGATRVVEDQVRGLLRQYPGQYEVTILCADKFSGDWGVDYSEWTDGVRIVRLRLPGKEWSAWLDTDVESFMRTWLRAEAFDLVHVHAIQVLTASVLKPVRDAGIPYFVTLHDAWWICEHQFLTKTYGEAVDPDDWMSDLEVLKRVLASVDTERRSKWRAELEGCLDALFENAKAAEAINTGRHVGKRSAGRKMPSLAKLTEDRVGMDKKLEHLVPEQTLRVRLYSSLVRRRELTGYLGSASGVFAVSPSFANLHAHALDNSPTVPPAIETLTNGWQPYPCVGARRSEHPLRCAFIGGWSVHKGAAVVREAVARVKTRDLELTVIDYGLGRQEEHIIDWGGIDVCFKGPRGLGEMGDFYASMDVLLAPSIWPESFGLVTREALSAGVWVIATDIGALAEPIEQGVNGAIVPARDAQALADALDYAASLEGTAARMGWRSQAGIWLKELPPNDNLATLHARYGESINAQ